MAANKLGGKFLSVASSVLGMILMEWYCELSTSISMLVAEGAAVAEGAEGAEVVGEEGEEGEGDDEVDDDDDDDEGSTFSTGIFLSMDDGLVCSS